MVQKKEAETSLDQRSKRVSSVKSQKIRRFGSTRQKRSLFRWFAETTTFHGFSRVVSGRNRTRSLIWLIAICIAFLTVMCIIAVRVAKYFKYETVTEINQKAVSELEFPAITICNYNLIRKSSVSRDFGYDYAEISRFEVPHIVKETGPVTEDGAQKWLTYDENPNHVENDTTGPPPNWIAINLVTVPFVDNESYQNQQEAAAGFTTERQHHHLEKRFYTERYTEFSADQATLEPNKLDVMTYYTELEEKGWQLNDLNISDPDQTTLLECEFNGVTCNSKWFQRVLTPMGNCYTFNDATLNFIQWKLHQRQAGHVYGLRLFLDIQRYEYTSDYHYVGAKVLVHRPEEKPDVTQEGVSVPPGMVADLRFTRSEIHNHYKPWGECEPHRKLFYTPEEPYTRKACAAECRLQKVLAECSCKPYFASHYLLDAKVCNDSVWKICAEPLLKKIDNSFEDCCRCPISCFEVDFNPQVSYIGLTDDHETVKILNQKYYGKQEGNTLTFDHSYFYTRNVIGLKLYFSSMLLTTIKENKALDEIGLISEIGGQLGLFVGVSMLTLCEVMETIVLACCRRRVHGVDSDSESEDEGDDV